MSLVFDDLVLPRRYDLKHLTLHTTAGWGATMLRLFLGIVLFAHGSRSMLGWFGGGGIMNTIEGLHLGYGLPRAIAFLVVCIQFFGSLMLFTGTLTRLAATGVAGIFIGMIVTAHLDHGFFMNWSGSAAGEGFEYHLLVLGICAALICWGGGHLSVDKWIMDRPRH